MEQKLGVTLPSDIDVHHIDGDAANNNIDNLQIVERGVHQAKHSTKYTDKYIICPECQKEFLWTAIGILFTGVLWKIHS